MPQRTQLPVALTIAGSDSGGGAGIQADLKTFGALGVHGTSAITCITAQNPRRVLGVEAIPPAMVRRQLEAVWTELPPAAVKTGMLYSAEIIKAVAQFLKRVKHPPLVVDPVMVATSGARLLKASAVKTLEAELLPLATVMTPNLPEAELLLGKQLRSLSAMHAGARELHERHGCAALIKGGHFHHATAAMDVYFDGEDERLLVAPLVHGVSTHGTGCAFSAAITAGLANGQRLGLAVEQAKRYITGAIERHAMAGRHTVLGYFENPSFASSAESRRA